jgi:DNA gyrase subunit A
LEHQKLEDEFQEKTQQRADLQRLLSDRKELLKAMKKELRSLKKKFSDERRTRIQTEAERAEETQQLEEIIAEEVEEEAVLEFTQKGYVRRSSPRSYQRRQAKLTDESNPKLHEVEDDVVLQVEKALTTQELLTITRDGKAYTLAVNDIPVTQRQSRGAPLVNLLPGSVPADADVVATQMLLTDDILHREMILVTRQGKIKRVPVNEFTNLTGRGLTAMKVKKGMKLPMFSWPK